MALGPSGSMKDAVVGAQLAEAERPTNQACSLRIQRAGGGVEIPRDDPLARSGGLEGDATGDGDCAGAELHTRMEHGSDNHDRAPGGHRYQTGEEQGPGRSFQFGVTPRNGSTWTCRGVGVMQ